MDAQEKSSTTVESTCVLGFQVLPRIERDAVLNHKLESSFAIPRLCCVVNHSSFVFSCRCISHFEHVQMEARFVCLLLVVLCVVNVGAEFIKGRSLSYFPVWPCRRACKAVNRTDPEVLRKMIANDRDLCGCVCNMTTGAGLLHTAVESKCTLCVDVRNLHLVPLMLCL